MNTTRRRRVRVVEGSCWECKANRVKCKLQKPACSRCVDRGLECEYVEKKTTYKWVEARPFRRRRRSVESSSSCSSPEPVTPREVVPFLHHQPTPHFDSDYRLMYFQKIVSPRLTARSVPWDYDSIRFASQDGLLKDLIDALSCAHLIGQSKTDSPVFESKEIARMSALKTLSSTLRFDLSSQGNPHAVFAGSVLLGILDGVIEPDSGQNRPSQHIQGGRAILDGYGHRLLANSPQVMNSLNAEIMSVFATMDLTYSLLTGAKPYFDSLFWSTFANCDAWWGNLQESDPFLEILAILTRLAVLGHDIRANATQPSPAELLQIQSALAAHVIPPRNAPDSLVTSRSWLYFCSAYANMASIYCLRALWSLPMDDPQIQNAVAGFVEDLICASNDTLQHCLLFPLLIAGFHSLDARQRDVIKSSCLTCYGYLFFGNIKLIVFLLEQKWTQDKIHQCYDDGDVQPTTSWWDDFEDFGKKTFVF